MPTVALTIKCGATFFNQLFHSAECQYLGATRPPETSFSGDYQRARYPQEQLLRRHPTTDWPAVHQAQRCRARRYCGNGRTTKSIFWNLYVAVSASGVYWN